MKDEIISFETAKLAKEKGFNVQTLFWYFISNQAGLDYILVDYIGDGQFGEVLEEQDHGSINYLMKRFNAPTQSLLQKWLREKHYIHVEIYSFKQNDIIEYCFCTSNYNIDLRDETIVDEINFLSYEEALEQGLQEALKLI